MLLLSIPLGRLREENFASVRVEHRCQLVMIFDISNPRYHLQNLQPLNVPSAAFIRSSETHITERFTSHESVNQLTK